VENKNSVKILVLILVILMLAPLYIQWGKQSQLNKDIKYSYKILQDGIKKTMQNDGVESFSQTKLYELLCRQDRMSENNEVKINEIVKKSFDIKNVRIQSVLNTSQRRKRYDYSFYLDNGALVVIEMHKYTNNDKISFYVDVNGYKPPNDDLSDTFTFRVNDKGKLIPCDSGVENLYYLGLEKILKADENEDE